jgi:GTPase SAR1 family protein/ribosomal protein L37AE/L43A
MMTGNDEDKKFDIKVALIGYVSVGKTTVLNALLRDKYGEVAMGRATASVNHYAVAVASSTPESVVSSSSTAAAARILDQTIDANARLRSATTVEEAWFDVTVDQSLGGEMRDDTRLVVVDIPGINEAGTSHKYKDYVVEHWHTLDCVVIVMDGRQGVNTQEQVDLLRFAKTNCDTIKAVPVIVLCNKIEDPEEGEQSALIAETRQSVQTIFATGDDQVTTLEETLAVASQTSDRGNAPFPPVIVLPVSAIHAFIYQAGSRGGLHQFQHFFDKDLIEKIGKDNFGRKWLRLDHDQKLERAYGVLCDTAQCQEGIDLSNFDKFISLLTYCIGGRETQRAILKSQLDVALSRLVPELEATLVVEFRKIYLNSKALKLSVEELPTRFWTIFDQIVANHFALFKTPTDVTVIATPMELLLSYAQFVKEVGWTEEIEMVNKHAQTLVSRQAMHVINQFDRGNEVSRPQLVLLYGSLLLQASESFFYRNFGLLKIIMEDRARAASSRSESAYKCSRMDCAGQLSLYTAKIWRCPHCGTTVNSLGGPFPTYNMVDGVLAPVVDEGFAPLLSVPDSLEDPKHYGHLIWQFGRIIKILGVE